MKQGLLIILLFSQMYCLGQSPKIKAQRIEEIIVNSEAAGGITRDCKNFLLVKKCVEPNKDTIYFYQDTGKYKLLKISRVLYNPKHEEDLRIDFWTYYFLERELIMVTNGHIVDYGRVYSFTDYYFENRKNFYRFGSEYNLRSSKWILDESDEYLERWKREACR